MSNNREFPPAQNRDFAVQLIQMGEPLAILNGISPLCIEYTLGKNRLEMVRV